MRRHLIALAAACLTLFMSAFIAAPVSAQGYFEPYEAENSMGLEAGDILIDSAKRKLYFAYDDDILLVYPVAVGREGAGWKGSATIERMVDGPSWYPTADQKRKRKLPDVVGPGPGNPLGEYALYLYQDGRDTLIGIHGTNNPASIGKAVSDGCFRMRNEHVGELFGYVYEGSRVTVR